MTDQCTTRRMLIAVALMSLCLPVIATAQGRYDPWGRERRDDGYYRRDRRRGDDDYRRRDEADRRYLRDTVRRVKEASKDFQKQLDRELDHHGRYKDSRYEDRAKDVAKEFRKAADALENRFDDGRDLYRSESEARRLLYAAERVEQLLSRNRVGSRTWDEWSNIREDLRVIADAYGLRLSDYRDDDYRRGRGRLPIPIGNRPWWWPRF